jgi:hypothetical protein
MIFSCRRTCQSESPFQELFAVLSSALPLGRIPALSPRPHSGRPPRGLAGDYASASSPRSTCRKSRLHGYFHLIDSIIYLPCFKTCKALRRTLRNLRAGSAAPAPHCKRVLRGSTQHQKAGCGGRTMLLRWHLMSALLRRDCACRA